MFRGCLGGRPYPRDTRENQLSPSCPDSLHSSHVQGTCIISRDAYSRATRENTSIFNALSLHTLSLSHTTLINKSHMKYRVQKTYPSTFGALEQIDPIPALTKTPGQTSLHKGMERPVLALLKALEQVPIQALSKALGQVPSFPYWDKPIPALLKVLEQGPPIPTLLKASGQVFPRREISDPIPAQFGFLYQHF